MSTQYRSSHEVPLRAIVKRLRELSEAIITGREARDRELTMRIPAECDRDADLVLAEAARRIESLHSEVVAAWAEAEKLRADNAELQAAADSLYADNMALQELTE